MESKIGAGGMGVVYKALDTHLHRTVAIKVLPAEAVADPVRRQRFIQEARAASALDHPNIVTIHDIAETDGQHFIVMQYIAGKTLRELLRRGGLPLNETLLYAIQSADALAQAHARGIVHRDLKPENVMATEQGQVKILDFGLTKLTERTQENEFAATVSMPHQGARTEEGTLWGPWGICRRSRRKARRSTHGRTCFLLEPSYTRCWPAGGRLREQQDFHSVSDSSQGAHAHQ